MTTTTPTDASADDLVRRLKEMKMGKPLMMESRKLEKALRENSGVWVGPGFDAKRAADIVSKLRDRLLKLEMSGTREADRIEHLQAQLAEAQAQVGAATQERDDMLRLMLGLPFDRSIDDKDLAWARDAITQQRAAMSGKETTR